MKANSSFVQQSAKQRIFSSRPAIFIWALCALMGAAAPEAKAEYTFTLIADSAGAFSNFGSYSSPSLNSSGTVAFYAALDNGRYGIFTGSGGATATIALNPQQQAGYGYPSINQSGME